MTEYFSWVKVKNGLKMNEWITNHLPGLFVFNLSLLLLVLLNTAGYFKPFYYIGINTIFFLSLIMGILLLELRTKSLFAISLIFLVLSAFLKILKIDIWADRASIYFYEALIFGLLLMLLDYLGAVGKSSQSEKK